MARIENQESEVYRVSVGHSSEWVRSLGNVAVVRGYH